MLQLTDIHGSQPPHFRNDAAVSPARSSVIWRGTEYLSRISESMVTVSETTGKTIADARSVFHDIDTDYFDWRLDKPGRPTKRHRVLPFKQKKDGTTWELFYSLGTTKELLQRALEQEQITNFVLERPDLLSEDEYATLFLMKKGDKLMVASVRVKENKRRRINFRYIKKEDDVVWLAEDRRNVIVGIL